MISSLYDEVIKKGVPNSEWESYMKQLYEWYIYFYVWIILICLIHSFKLLSKL